MVKTIARALYIVLLPSVDKLTSSYYIAIQQLFMKLFQRFSHSRHLQNNIKEKRKKYISSRIQTIWLRQ